MALLLKWDEEDDEGRVWGETLKVKVRMETKKPLRRGTKIKVGSMAEEVWIPITIEKLPDFCYQCGRLGHVMNECEEDDSEEEDEEENQYSPWMRGSSVFKAESEGKKKRGKKDEEKEEINKQETNGSKHRTPTAATAEEVQCSRLPLLLLKK